MEAFNWLVPSVNVISMQCEATTGSYNVSLPILKVDAKMYVQIFMTNNKCFAPNFPNTKQHIKCVLCARVKNTAIQQMVLRGKTDGNENKNSKWQ